MSSLRPGWSSLNARIGSPFLIDTGLVGRSRHIFGTCGVLTEPDEINKNNLYILPLGSAKIIFQFVVVIPIGQMVRKKGKRNYQMTRMRMAKRDTNNTTNWAGFKPRYALITMCEMAASHACSINHMH